MGWGLGVDWLPVKRRGKIRISQMDVPRDP